MLNALRLNEGVVADSFSARTGLTLETIAAPLRARVDGLLADAARVLRATPLGLRFSQRPAAALPAMSADWIMVHCPYCGERFEAAVEAELDEDQVIDCAVCCRPIHLHVHAMAASPRSATTTPERHAGFRPA